MPALRSFLRGGRLRSAIDRSLAVIEFRPDGRIIRANQNFLDLMEYELREIRGHHHRMFVVRGERNSAEYQMFWQHLRSGKFHSAEFRRITKSGREVWIQATYNPIFDIFGRVRRVMKFATDVTEQKSQSASHASQIDAITRSQAVIEFTLDGTILTANQNFLDALGGYSLDDIQGQHHRMFVDREERESAAYRQFWGALRAGAFQSGEFRRISKSGAEVWIRAVYNPVSDPNGNPVRVVKLATDVTEEVRMRRRMETLSLVANETDSSVVITDAEQRIEYVNRGFERLTGYSAEEVAGKKPGDFLQGPLTDVETVARIGRMLRDRKSIYEEILNYDKSGKPYWISLSINPVFDDRGELKQYVSIQANVTSTKLQAVEFDTQISAIGSVNAVATWNPSVGSISLNERFQALGGTKPRLEDILDPSAIAAIAGGAVARHEIRWPTTGGQVLWFDAVFTATHDIKGDVAKVQMFGNDVTSRHRVVDQATHALEGVMTSSRQINDIASSLDQIARQTKLLSLNAAIESAHAGQHGAEFGVVAKQVGALAARSASEATKIAKLAGNTEVSVRDLSSSIQQLQTAAGTEAAEDDPSEAVPHPQARLSA